MNTFNLTPKSLILLLIFSFLLLPFNLTLAENVNNNPDIFNLKTKASSTENFVIEEKIQPINNQTPNQSTSTPSTTTQNLPEPNFLSNPKMEYIPEYGQPKIKPILIQQNTTTPTDSIVLDPPPTTSTSTATETDEVILDPNLLRFKDYQYIPEYGQPEPEPVLIPHPNPLNEQVLVVYNNNYTIDQNNNNFQDSLEIARYYQKNRLIASKNVLGINAPLTEEITRNEFELIKNQIQNYLQNQNLKTNVKYIVLIKGIPLKIKGTVFELGKADYSSLDSALCLLWQNYDVNWRIQNPYFKADTKYDLSKRFKSSTYSNESITLDYLVTRLDGYHIEDVLHLINQSLKAPESNNYNWAIDDHQKNYDSMKSAHQILNYLELNTLPETNWENTLDHITHSNKPIMGYTSHGIHAGMPDGYINSMLDFNYAPGATVSTYESFSAFGFKNPDQSTHGQLAEFIEAGASGGIGHVYEPWASGMAEENIWMPMYAIGYNWAEAAYMSIPHLDFTSVVIGDPLMFLKANQIPKNKIDLSIRYIDHYNYIKKVGEKATIGVSVENYSIYEITPQITVLINGEPVENLLPPQTKTIKPFAYNFYTYSFWLKESGPVNLKVIVDYENKIIELNENNNSLSETIIIEEGGPLGDVSGNGTVDAFDLSLAEEYLKQEQYNYYADLNNDDIVDKTDINLLTQSVDQTNFYPQTYSYSTANQTYYISFPMETEKIMAHQLFGPVMDKIENIYNISNYDSMQINHELQIFDYQNGKPLLIEPGKGYIINIKEPFEFTIKGLPLTQDLEYEFKLMNNGLGLVWKNFATTTPILIENFTPLKKVKYQEIYTKNPNTLKSQTYRGAGQNNDFEEFNYGQGYFVMVDKILPKATFSLTPNSISSSTTANFTISTSSAVAYKYSLNHSGWSQESPTTEPLSFTNLSCEKHSLQVIGKDGEGDWQNQEVTTSFSWQIICDSTQSNQPTPTPALKSKKTAQKPTDSKQTNTKLNNPTTINSTPTNQPTKYLESNNTNSPNQNKKINIIKQKIRKILLDYLRQKLSR